MDDIYDNLENYEDVTDVTELKNENKELKQKLEEYSVALNQLQKDIEKLNSEHKKLELNYSSLLITARAEIERKGEIIKNLNTEKDKLIINALQTKGKHMSWKSNNLILNQNCVESKDKPCGYKNNRIDIQAPSPPISSNTNENKTTTNTTNVDKLLNIDKKSVSNTEMKENIYKNIDKDDISSNKTSSSQRISNRRKSMPAASFQEAKFSSDEETDELYNKNNRKSPPRNLRHDNRDYRTDIHSHGSTDSSRSRNSNNFDHNTLRHNDNDMKRYHRNYSPERYQHRYSDYNRQRVLKSPPSDKYSRFKSRDRRYNYDRDPSHDRHRYYETSSLKHKTRNSFDEPNSKRLKTELYSKCSSQNSSYVSDREKVFSDRRYIAEPDIEQLSCQSPDYIHSDNHFSQHLIKEIRNVAATSLEDPRMSSKKYFLQSHNDQTFLFIPSARNIDIPCIDKELWGLESVKVPEALKIKSISENENYLNEIYKSMDDNESVESGEIQSLHDEVILSKAPENNKEPKLDFKRKNTSSNTTDTGQKVNKLEVRQSSSTCEYKVHKFKKIKECSNKVDKNTKVSSDINVTIQKSTKSNSKLKESDKKSKHSEEKYKQVTENVQDSVDLKNCNNNRQSSIDKTIQDKIRTVECDLELSDEESDTIEFQKEIEEKIVTRKRSKKTSATTKIDKPYTNSSSIKKQETEVHENQVLEQNTIETAVTQETCSTKNSSSNDSSWDSKKRRSKKKSESQETTCKEEKVTKDKKKSNEKNTKKISPEQNVNKFSDLFGDTSSLITPDDLGITANDNKTQDVKFGLMFENTQDAMDLNVQDVHKAEIEQSIYLSPTNSNVNNIIATAPNNEPNEPVNEFPNINISSSKFDLVEKEQHLKKRETPMETNSLIETVIISTGVQPQRDYNDLPALSVLNVENNDALATSTPYKLIAKDDKVITSQNSDSINTGNVSLGLTSSNINNSSSFNTDSNQIEDVPDFKIIVRKRKVIRKPT